MLCLNLKIGIMRKGRMLVEESPKALLSKYNSPFLETIVTNLFKTTKESDSNGENRRLAFFSSSSTLDEIVTTKSYSKLKDLSEDLTDSFTKLHKNPVGKNASNSYRKMKAVLIRNFINYLRNPL